MDVIKKITVDIEGCKIGYGQPVCVIAEVGGNFHNDVEKGKFIIKTAIDAGCDMVKLQTYTPDGLFNIDKAPENWKMAKELALPYELHRELVSYTRELGGRFLSTPSDKRDVEFLDKEFDISAYKLGSDDCTNYPFLDWLARRGKPIILSTGTCNLSEVSRAVDTVLNTGNDKLVLLQCTTSYPSRYEDANLNVIKTMQAAFPVPIGYSDHTLNNNCCFAAVALGASLVERHVTYDKNAPGPDHVLAADPEDLRALVLGVREIEAALGDGIKRLTEVERENNMIEQFRKSYFAKVDIPSGEKIKPEYIEAKRPAEGIKPSEYEQLIGRVAKRDIKKNENLVWDMF